MGIGNYPQKARRKHIGGKVTVKVYINESGDVYYALPIDGPKLLRASAANAASWSRFAPFEANGLPVKCAGLLVYNFVAQ
jgi:outer membrane biosynthesis protein TonB